jgi:hypothetical protein
LADQVSSRSFQSLLMFRVKFIDSRKTSTPRLTGREVRAVLVQANVLQN